MKTALEVGRGTVFGAPQKTQKKEKKSTHAPPFCRLSWAQPFEFYCFRLSVPCPIQV